MLRQAVLFIATLLLSVHSAAAGLKPGDPAPEFKLLALDGKTHTLSSLRTQGPVMLYFWSTECGFCRVMSPKINKLYTERAAPGFTVAAIDIDFNMREQVEAYVRERKLSYLILHGSLDNADAVEAYGVQGTPTLVVVNRDGRVRYYGHSLDEAVRHIR